jgi:DNA-binding GntR family transcriptional regulator
MPEAATSTFPTRAGSGRLTTLAYERVRSEILGRRLTAGTILTEGKLAALLGMSKTPVRHALRALHQEGLLEEGPRRQMVVRALPAAHRDELVQVREALERIAVSNACRHMSVDDLDHLRTLLRRQRRAAEAGRIDEFIDLDEQMHLWIASRAGLRLVPELLSQLRGFVSLMQLNARRDPGHLMRVLEEHERLANLIEARDEPGSLAALSDHLHTSEYIIPD